MVCKIARCIQASRSFSFFDELKLQSLKRRRAMKKLSILPLILKNAVEAACGIRFEPAAKDGKPFSVVKTIRNGFRIF
jgi:hypothetical protein